MYKYMYVCVGMDWGMEDGMESGKNVLHLNL